MPRKIKPEHKLQQDIVSRLREDGFIIIDADPMDALKYFGQRAGARFSYISVHKSRGYTPGQPDIIVAKNNKTVLVELKYGSKQSKEQIEFMMKCRAEGIDYRVIDSLKAAEEMIEEINRSRAPDPGN